MTEFRTLAIVTATLGALMLLALMSLHNSHYSKRRLILLEGDVETIRRLLKEDRTL